ncbi:LuxR C-terminal-related transcriptional regulator [Streptomyces sp. Ac-502]|uniref:LuxR C-terminal-related transcriptional regulator n=1 Tax=Streptomyces sp. Ac-502 TaxID=3342801 RepID=UPI003862D0D1
MTPPPVDPAHVTAREKQMLTLVAQGKSNKQIADVLCVAPTSVRTYLVMLRHKLGVRGHRATLARVAFRLRYVHPGTAEGEAPALTCDEQGLLRDVADGLTLNEIAAKNGESYDQAKVGVARLLSKLGADDRIEAMRICEQHGLLNEDADGCGPPRTARPEKAA